jgi:hypothetical protein
MYRVAFTSIMAWRWHVPHQHIFRFEVTINDMLLMQIFDGLCNLGQPATQLYIHIVNKNYATYNYFITTKKFKGNYNTR